MLTFCRTHKGKVHFVVFNLTRFARDKYDHFARRHLDGNLMDCVLAAFAQFDNDVRSNRTRAGMNAAPELGR